MNSLDQILSETRILVDRIVERNLTQAILLSGGLDTSVIAYAASKFTALNGFTVAFENSPALDLKYSKIMAKLLKMNHKIHFFSEEEMNTAIQEVIKILKVFDPMDIRNSVAVYIALSFAKENGTKNVMTGDGLDELLAGYSWLFNLDEEELNAKLSNMWKVMQFTSIPMAETLEMIATPPFLDPEFKTFAFNLNRNLMIRSERSKIWGKWIIRKAYEGLLPDEIVWRLKTPIEIGSGTTIFPKVFAKEISNKYFQNKTKEYLEADRVTIRDKEHLVYYEVFRSYFGMPSVFFKDAEGKNCPYCNSNTVYAKSRFCKVCGAYPI